MYSYIAKFESANFTDNNTLEVTIKSDNPLNDYEVLAQAKPLAETYFMEFDSFDWYIDEEVDPDSWSHIVSIEEVA